MGCFLSCSMGGSTASSPSTGAFKDCVRVVHINGYVEDFHGPVTAGEVNGKPPRLVLCSSAHLFAFGSPRQPPLIRLHDHLSPGRLYFLLPISIFQSDSSPVDLASLATRLTALANNNNNNNSLNRSQSIFTSFVSDQRSLSNNNDNKIAVESSTPPHLYSVASPVKDHMMVETKGPGYVYSNGSSGGGRRMSARLAGSWKPILDAIEEKSFGRSMRSDLSSNITT